MQDLKDRQARTRIEARVDRVAVGNFGDAATVGEGVMELRIDWGPGYRAYFARLGARYRVAPLRGRQTDTQKDIERAKGISRTTRRALRGKSRTAAPSLPYEPWLIEQLKDPAEAAAYLEAVIERRPGGDHARAAAVAQAQGGVAEWRASETHSRGDLQDAVQSGNPELRSLNAVLRATGLRIAVRPIEKQAA